MDGWEMEFDLPGTASSGDAVIELGSIDENNLFVTGGSGGGVLSSWISPPRRGFGEPGTNWRTAAAPAASRASNRKSSISTAKCAPDILGWPKHLRSDIVSSTPA